MRRVIVHLIAALFLSIGGATAQNLDIDRMSKDELNKLTEEQAKGLPVFKLWEKQGVDSALNMKAWALLTLRDLGYGFREAFTGNDDQLQRWVTQFQHDLGEPKTGILTVGQLDTLMKRSQVVKTSDVKLLLPGTDKDGGPEIIMDKNYASAKGTFILEDDKIGWPLNITRFECYREWGYCSQSDVDITDDDGAYYANVVTPTLLSIVSWNEDEIVANNEAICATTTTTINVKAKEVYQVTRNNGQSCAPLPPLAKPQIAKLVSGFKVSWDYFVKKGKEADGYRSKEYQQYLEALRADKYGVGGQADTQSQSKVQTDTVPGP